MEKEITIENLQQENAQLKNELEAVKNESRNYQTWYREERDKYAALKRKVNALVCLLADAVGASVDAEKLPF